MYKTLFEESKLINRQINLSELKNKSILITGATGLIGLFFLLSIKNIAKENNILLTAWINRDIPDYLKDIFENVWVIKGDICNIHNYNTPNFDVIIHAAGYGQPSKFLENKIKTITINTSVTQVLLNKLKTGGKFLFVSSSEVYNGLNDNNITEEMIGNTNPSHPRSCYIEGKRCGEAICNAFANSGTYVKIARLSLAYGPGIRPDDVRVINELIKKGLNEKQITLNDGGIANRTYCYVTDAIIMMWKIFLFGKDTTYNVGGQDQISILNLAQKISNILNVEVKIPLDETPLIGNPKNVNVSCDKFNKEFGNIKYKNIEYGLQKTIDWLKYTINIS
jgi:nucleoside-diphosphate-sugar epimerase